jgi:mono/diheme cytochrome c family protein
MTRSTRLGAPEKGVRPLFITARQKGAVPLFRWTLALAAVSVAIFAVPALAHKPITSKYTYNADVFPIFRDRCGACHAAGGIAPMSLLTYKEALPWAESIREELIGEQMPPWFVDPRGAGIRDAHAMSPREIDTLVTWATGGTPEGNPSQRPKPIARLDAWPAGPPDVRIPMNVDYIMPADARDTVQEIVLPTGFTSPRRVTLADLRPGSPDLVRDATIAIDDGPLLAVWMPGDSPQRTPAGTAFDVAAGARLRLRIHYKKPWQDERKARSDRSIVGLYFAEERSPTRNVETVSIEQDTAAPRESETPLSRRFDAAATIVSLRPQLDQPYAELEVHAVDPSGTDSALLRLHRPRPEWSRRYWLQTPANVAAGSRIEVRVVPAPIDPDEPPRVHSGVLQVGIGYVRR